MHAQPQEATVQAAEVQVPLLHPAPLPPPQSTHVDA
jgi:hypothetical protein